jgi:hypothetical protein
MTVKGEHLTPEQRLAYNLGFLRTEQNTILSRIRRRASGEPTKQERKRLAELRDRITNLKRGGDDDGYRLVAEEGADVGPR